MLFNVAFLSLVLPAFGAVHEALESVPAGWTEVKEGVHASSRVNLQVALKYRNVESLEERLMDVSDPESANYGKHLDRDEMHSIFSPSADSLESVKAWLKDAGVTAITSDSYYVTFSTTVARANKLLDANFAHYTNGKYTKLRTLSYSIPDSLGDAVDLIHPTTFFGNMKAHSPVPAAQPEPPKWSYSSLEERAFKPSCERAVTFSEGKKNVTFNLIGPQCLQELYNIGGYTPKANSGSTVAFGSFLEQSASYSDLKKFEQIYKIPAKNFTVISINGGKNTQNPQTEQDGEANLDVQNIVGLVGELPVTEYITGGLAPIIPDLLEPNNSLASNEPYLQYYTYLLKQKNANLPYVISNSYGDHENTVPEAYAKRVCNMIGMMGMRGRTILESSGDEGTGAVCRTNVGKTRPEFTPQFPGTCPYVTAIGGTQFTSPEWAWNASSGGFSNYFKQPSYQKKAVNTYLTKYISSKAMEYYSSNKYANFSGRGFPDISAHSLYPYYLTVINGSAVPNGGTSAASPVVAAIMSLLNDALLRKGKSALGFVNPLLYGKASSTLNDITHGAAVGCAGVDLQTGEKIKGAGIIPYASWNATVGWDPATGLGTPNFQKMLSMLA